MLEIRQAAIANQLAETAAAASAEVFAKRSSPAVQCDLTDSLQSLTDEVLALRREQARLQQAIFEAAQVQRRLCAPRELTWGEFEIAGEIFPVRHLSGDFFKVVELGSTLGLALGDIAGVVLRPHRSAQKSTLLLQRRTSGSSSPQEQQDA